MSLAYAEALTYREDLGGQVGDPELFDPPAAVAAKAAALADLIAAAAGGARPPAVPPVVVFTGAGLSTAAGIPDFRGPDGVWTRQRDGRPPPSMAAGPGGGSFALARPTYAHAALVALTQAGLVSLVVSQNVDGLHGRAGQPAGTLAELHGNVFGEECGRSACGAAFFRDFETGSVGRKPTKRRCDACGGRLRDGVLDWEQALPAGALAAAEAAADGAAVALALGTSLQIVPACEIPLRTVRAGGKLAIVNLQATPKDGAAGLVVRARCDEVMREVMSRLACKGLVPHALPPWVRTDAVAVVGRLSLGKRARGEARKGTATISLASPGGEGDAWPVVAMVAGLDVWVEDDGDGDGGGGDLGGGEPDARLARPPWRVVVPVALGGSGGRVRVRARLGLSPAADAGVAPPVVDFTLTAERCEFREVVEWESQRVEWGEHAAGGAAAEPGRDAAGAGG